MSTRASLYADPEGKAKELAESTGWIPLLWIGLLSSADLKAWRCDRPCVTTDRKEAMERCQRAVPFLSELFPEFAAIDEVAADFLRRLKKVKASTIGVDFCDHMDMKPNFLPSLEVAIAAIESCEKKAVLTVPAQTFESQIDGWKTTMEERKYNTTREVLCWAASMHPGPDQKEEILKDQLVGYLLV